MPEAGAVLRLRVENHCVLDIQYGHEQLLERINGYLGYRAIASVRIIQGPIASRDNEKARSTSDVSGGIRKAVCKQLDTMDPGRLKEALYKLAARIREG
jgi:hypothetical protein